MEKTSSSAVLALPTAGTSSCRGSAVTHSHNALVSEFSGRHASVRDIASSTIGGTGSCGGAGLPPSPFAWDVDGTHAQALVSPVMLSSKKKGGLLSGLKKMFNQQPKDDGRAATGQGQRGANSSVTSSDGTGRPPLDPSLCCKMDRSVKSPHAGNPLRLQVSSSRDLSLAALLTSPVRGIPTAAAQASSAVLNSPMPPFMRLDHQQTSTSFNNISFPHTDGDPSYSSSSNLNSPGEQQQRLFRNFSKNGRNNENNNNAAEAAAAGQSSSQLLYTGTQALAASLPSHKAAWPANPLTWARTSPSSSQQQQQQQHPAAVHQGQLQPGPRDLQKSLSTALTAHPSTAFSGGNLSVHVGRRNSIDDHRSSGSGASGRVALPYITSPRNQQLQQQQDSSYHGGNAAASPFFGRASPVTPPAVPELEPEAGCDEEYDAHVAAEEEDEQLGSVLLGMNPSVPQAMRRRKWTLDDYQVTKRMYKGATSAVYRATCIRSGLTVALKVYFLSKVPVNVVHMIRREIELHLPLVHRNIVMLYGAFQDEKHIVLVEEFAARGDLFGIHRSMNCRLTETQTSELILAPFLDALSYLHARGIMHRDIKPENILFTNEWTLKIADFGVSINVQEERAVTRTGTADYMAPEVERCPLKHAPEDNKNNPHLAYTPAIDIWSVGVLAYEMLVGFPPFVSNGQGEEGAAGRPGVAAFLAEQATRKTLRFPASVSPAAKDFIMATLNQNPGDRPTAQQLLKHSWLFKAARRISTNSTSRLSNANLVGVQY